ncbi:hypothetical protein [Hyalangium versicolor]|uniref:hypothetical protein n=1 Tax=Hyalangium versicolor TaxID=2861190 RepID=UPI001CCFDC23|nr:hypothetical protein [Hyalangium versicolor]
MASKRNGLELTLYSPAELAARKRAAAALHRARIRLAEAVEDLDGASSILEAVPSSARCMTEASVTWTLARVVAALRTEVHRIRKRVEPKGGRSHG